MTDTDLVKFNIPAAYVLGRAIPTRAEIAWGYRRGWLDEAGVVALADAAFERGTDVSQQEVDLALLRPSEFAEVTEVIGSLERALPSSEEDPSSLWLFLALSWVRHYMNAYDSPFETVAMIHADFNYPEEIEGFVGYMPTPPGEQPGFSGMHDRWYRYLRREADRFQARAGGQAGGS